MKRHLLFLLTTIILLTGCSQKEGTNEKVMEIVNSKAYTAENIDKIATIIATSTDLTDVQVDTLRMYVGDFICQYAEHLCDSLNDRLNDPNLTSEEMSQLFNDINNMADMANTTGVEIFRIEGYVTYDISPIFIADMFRSYISDEEYEFAEIEELELKEPSNIDAEVTVSYEEVAERLWNCDRLMMSDSCTDDLKVSLKPYINTYLIIMLYGADNTPAFDWDTHLMSPDVKDAILNYVTEHPDAGSTAVLKEYISVLEKSNYYESQATRAFYFNYLRNN